MAMTVSTYLANKLLDKVLRAVDFTTAPVYVSLHSSNPGITGAAEISGGSYSRQQVSTVNWNAAASRATSQLNLLQWLSMPSAALAYAGLYDAASNGNFLVGGPLASTATISSGDTYQMNIGQLVVTFL